MEPCRGKRHDQNGRSEAKKGQTDAPTKLRGLAGRKFTAEAVDSLHGTAAELPAAVSGPNGIRSPVVRQASLYCPLFSTNSRQTKDEPIRPGGIAEVSGENPAQLQEIRTFDSGTKSLTSFEQEMWAAPGRPPHRRGESGNSIPGNHENPMGEVVPEQTQVDNSPHPQGHCRAADQADRTPIT